MKLVFNFIIGTLLVILAVLAISYLQYRFDQSDLKQAVQAVQAARPSGSQGPTIGEQLSRKFGVPLEQISWVPILESKTKGRVKVQAIIPKNNSEFIWEVDLVRHQVVPVSEEAKSPAIFQENF